MGGKLTWLILVATGAVALLAGIDALRGSGSPAQATPPTQTTTDARATTPEQVETDPPAPATFSLAEFDAAMRERFDALGHEPRWYGHITGMKVAHESLKVATDLDPDHSETATKICSAVIKFAFDFGLESVVVFASDGRTGGGCA